MKKLTKEQEKIKVWLNKEIKHFDKKIKIHKKEINKLEKQRRKIKQIFYKSFPRKLTPLEKKIKEYMLKTKRKKIYEDNIAEALKLPVEKVWNAMKKLREDGFVESK